jgi:hypothetical protein
LKGSFRWHAAREDGSIGADGTQAAAWQYPKMNWSHPLVLGAASALVATVTALVLDVFAKPMLPPRTEARVADWRRRSRDLLFPGLLPQERLSLRFGFAALRLRFFGIDPPYEGSPCGLCDATGTIDRRLIRSCNKVHVETVNSVEGGCLDASKLAAVREGAFPASGTRSLPARARA